MTDTTATSKKPLEGRVAQILNERELVITIGSEAGVKKGMKFKVLSQTPIEIKDPETETVLDVLYRDKVRVEAHEVRERITVCRTYRVFRVPEFPIRRPNIFHPSGEIQETLRADGASFPTPLSTEETYVKVNDRVVELEE